MEDLNESREYHNSTRRPINDSDHKVAQEENSIGSDNLESLHPSGEGNKTQEVEIIEDSFGVDKSIEIRGFKPNIVQIEMDEDSALQIGTINYSDAGSTKKKKQKLIKTKTAQHHESMGDSRGFFLGEGNEGGKKEFLNSSSLRVNMDSGRRRRGGYESPRSHADRSNKSGKSSMNQSIEDIIVVQEGNKNDNIIEEVDSRKRESLKKNKFSSPNSSRMSLKPLLSREEESDSMKRVGIFEEPRKESPPQSPKKRNLIELKSQRSYGIMTKKYKPLTETKDRDSPHTKPRSRREGHDVAKEETREKFKKKKSSKTRQSVKKAKFDLRMDSKKDSTKSRRESGTLHQKLSIQSNGEGEPVQIVITEPKNDINSQLASRKQSAKDEELGQLDNNSSKDRLKKLFLKKKNELPSLSKHLQNQQKLEMIKLLNVRNSNSPVTGTNLEVPVIKKNKLGVVSDVDESDPDAPQLMAKRSNLDPQEVMRLGLIRKSTTMRNNQDRKSLFFGVNYYNKNSKFLFNIEGKFKTTWDLFMSALVIYVAFGVPYKFSFLKDNQGDTVFKIIDWFVDICFVFDLVFTFFTPYYENHTLVTSYWDIAINYICSGWFYIDLVSVIPFELVLSDVVDGYSGLLKISKVPRLYRVLKLARLFRTFGIKRKGGGVLPWIYNFFLSRTSYAQLLPTYSLIFMVSHFGACIWHYFAFEDNSPTTWISRNNLRDTSNLSRYLSSLYFVFQTITTVGYGDIGVETKTELALSIVMMFIGVLFYSGILTKILDMITDNMYKQDKAQYKIMLLKQVIQEIPTSETIRREMMRVIKQDTVDQVATMLGSKFRPNFENVNAKDAEELLYEVYNPKFAKIQMFSFLSKPILIEIAMNRTKHYFNQDDIIYKKGASANKFYMLKGGSVQFLVQSKGGLSIPFIHIQEGFFGEFELLENRGMHSIKRQTTCMAASPDTKVYSIEKDLFYKIFVDGDTEIAKAMRNHTIRRKETFKKASNETMNVMNPLLLELKKEKEKSPIFRFQKFIRSNKFKKYRDKVLGITDQNELLDQFQDETIFVNRFFLKTPDEFRLVYFKQIMENDREINQFVRNYENKEEGITLYRDENTKFVDELYGLGEDQVNSVEDFDAHMYKRVVGEEPVYQKTPSKISKKKSGAIESREESRQNTSKHDLRDLEDLNTEDKEFYKRGLMLKILMTNSVKRKSRKRPMRRRKNDESDDQSQNKVLKTPASSRRAMGGILQKLSNSKNNDERSEDSRESSMKMSKSRKKNKCFSSFVMDYMSNFSDEEEEGKKKQEELDDSYDRFLSGY